MQDYLHGDDEVPYIERQDLAYEKKKKERTIQIENSKRLLHERQGHHHNKRMAASP